MNEQPVLMIVVRYSCVECGVQRRQIHVPAREEEDIHTWMEMMIDRVSLDHRSRSPFCRAANMTEVLIPMSGTDREGGPTRQ